MGTTRELKNCKHFFYSRHKNVANLKLYTTLCMFLVIVVPQFPLSLPLLVHSQLLPHGKKS